MRLQPRSAPPDPIGNAVSRLLDDADDALTLDHRKLLAWTDGVLTAAAIGPRRTRPQDWIPLLFERGRAFDNIVSAETANALLALMHNKILSELRSDGPDYTPCFLEFAEDGEEIELGMQWANGFLHGMHLHEGAVGRLIDTEQGKRWLTVIVLLASDSDGNPLVAGRSAEELIETRQEALWMIGPSTFALYGHWKGQRDSAAPSLIDPFRKVGRNEPCPCGSGKKHKKCCLDRLD